jgi:acetyltransferase-like isoleucine patch superfamily enzyme
VHFKGKAKLGFASKISVDGKLIVGENFHVSAASSIICRRHIEIGSHCLMAWESLIVDSDLHPIYDFSDNRINNDQAVLIGDHCWIGAKSSILKGSVVANNTVIGLASVVTGKYEQEYTVLAGNPAIVIKKDVKWKE